MAIARSNSRSPESEPFSVEMATSGDVTLVTLRGTLHDGFGGQKVARAIRTKKVVVSMRDLRRFASWGMTEWMDFLQVSAKRDLYLVECSTYAVGQINLVTGLLGHAKLVSFYGSYRCGACSEELERLLLVPRDRAEIRSLPDSHEECSTCGGRARLEEYPAAFFEAIAGRPSFDIDDEVLAFLRSRFGYDVAPDLTRFRAYRSVRKDYTYLRLSGSLAQLPSELLANASQGTTVLDLSGIQFDAAGVAAWRAYLQAVRAKLTSLQLLQCPVGFLESALTDEDLRETLKVRTFEMPYECLRCDTPVVHVIDVADSLEQLVRGSVPPLACKVCQSALLATVTPALSARLRSVPARERDPALDQFLSKARALPPDKLDNALVAASEPPRASARPSRVIYVALAVCLLVIGGLGGLVLRNQRSAPPAVVVPAPPAPVPAPRPSFTRPDWIVSDVPASAYCHDMINRVMCVGVSSYSPTREVAVAEASEAALEELVNAIGLKITTPYFRDNVAPGYSASRAKALSDLQAADVDRTSAAYAQAVTVARKARKRVVEILQSSGGAAVPSQRSDWYWEEYSGERGKPNETLVFVRYDVPLDAMRALVETYATATSAMGTSALTAFPAIAWQYTEFSGGALLTKVGRPLARAGIAPASTVTAVGDQHVSDAKSFAHALEELAATSSAFKLTVSVGDASGVVVTVPR